MDMHDEARLAPSFEDLFGPQAAPVRGTVDLYGPVHKGLRAAQAGLLVEIGAQDWSDTAGVLSLLDALRRLLALGAEHLEHEEKHIHAALDALLPDAAARPRHQHDGHEAAFADLGRLIEGLAAAPAKARPAMGRALYHRFAAFMAEDLHHMAEEEFSVQPMLQALLGDAGMQALHDAILADIPAESMAAYMAIIVPALSPAERTAMGLPEPMPQPVPQLARAA